MVKNLLNTGTPFDYKADDANYAEDLLVVDPDSDEDLEFEDER